MITKIFLTRFPQKLIPHLNILLKLIKNNFSRLDYYITLLLFVIKNRYFQKNHLKQQ